MYLPQHNATFQRPPRDPATAFVPLGDVNLDTILCHEAERVIAPDNTVLIAGHVLQIDRQPGRRTCAGLRVLARQHLNGTITIIRPPNIVLGHFSADGQPVRTKRVATRSDRHIDRETNHVIRTTSAVSTNSTTRGPKRIGLHRE